MRTRSVNSGMARPRRRTAALLLPLLAGLALCGCTRKYWREQADELSYNILESKYQDPYSAPPRIDVRPTDPRSRFADPYDPDRPPLPPDDPAANEYMRCVYGMKGYKKWNKFGNTATVENPNWLDGYGLSQEVVESNAGANALLPELRDLTLVDAVNLSYIHSRDYQLQLETVYLNALALTLERFRFNVQFFGLSNRRPSNDTFYESGPNGDSSFTSFTRAGVGQYLPTGGQWLVELANNTIWLVGGGDKNTTTSSVISYSLIQPLLAGGGKRFALENLTQTERNVLYAMRNFSRFRQGFFVSTVVGAGPVGTNSANLTASGSVGTNFAALSGAGISGTVGGYLGLLQARQQILNQRDNIRRTEQQLLVLRAKASQRPQEIGEPLPELPDGLVIPDSVQGQLRYDAETHVLYWRGEVTPVQITELLALSAEPGWQRVIRDLTERAGAETITRDVSQLDTQLAGLRIQLANLEVQLQNSYDSYKIQLGLPTDMIVSVDEALLKPFELIDLRVVTLQDRITRFIAQLAPIDDVQPDVAALRRVAAELAELRADLRRDGIEVTANDFERLEQHRERRLAAMATDEDRAQFEQDVDRDRRLFANLRQEFDASDERLAELRRTLASPRVPVADARSAARALADLREASLKTSQGLSVLQIDLRVELIDLNSFDMPMEDAVAIGLQNRQDLMNARAQVMDARRKVEVAANQLQAVVSLVATGSINTPSNASGNVKPFDFREDLNTIKAGVAFTSPIQLVVQRNVYRAALIFYEQARRNYMAVEDGTKQSVRVAWRQLNLQRRNLDLARHQVRIAAVQYDQAVELTSAPAGPGQQGNQQQGLNLLNALNAILNAENNLINLWVQYETSRLIIYRDMGIMEIDPQGFWTDEYYQGLLRDAEASGTSVYAPLFDPPLPLPPDSQDILHEAPPAIPADPAPAPR